MGPEMDATAELLPQQLTDFRLPPGLEMPRNVLLTEDEAAEFLREPVSRLRSRRYDGTGPAFFKPHDEPWAVKYLVWDLLAWVFQHRRTEMPERPRRGSRKGAVQAAA